MDETTAPVLDHGARRGHRRIISAVIGKFVTLVNALCPKPQN